ncbi:MAG: hypothetical protein AB1679_14500 [Actinomycetota bacterium]
MVRATRRLVVTAMAAGFLLAGMPSAPAEEGEGIVGIGRLMRDAQAGPALLGTAVGVGVGLPLTILGYPEYTGPLAQNVVPPVADSVNNAGPIYGGVLKSAEAGSKGFSPILNPTLLPLMQAGGQAFHDHAPGLGLGGTFGHLGAPPKDEVAPGGASGHGPLAEDTINYSSSVRAVPTRMLAQVPLEVDAGPEAKVDAANGYGTAIAHVSPGAIPATLMWSGLGLFGGTLIPHPAYSQSNYPTGPTSDTRPIAVAGQSDESRWGTFETSVGGDGQGRALAAGGRIGSPGIWSADAVVSSTQLKRADKTVVAELYSALGGLDVGGVLQVEQLASRMTVQSNGTKEGRSTKFEPAITGARVGGIPVVIASSGVSVAGTEGMSAKQRQAAQDQVNSALKSAGLSVSVAPLVPRDELTDSGATAAASGAALRITFNRPDRPQTYQIDFGFVDASVFVGIIESFGESAAPGGADALGDLSGIVPAGGDSQGPTFGAGGLMPGLRPAGEAPSTGEAALTPSSTASETLRDSGSGEFAGSGPTMSASGSEAGHPGGTGGGSAGGGSTVQAAAPPLSGEVNWAAASSKVRSLYGGLLAAALAMGGMALVVGRRVLQRLLG